MSNTNALINAVVSQLKAKFTTLKTCVALPGYLESTDLSSVHANTPGVFVAAVGTGDIVPIETGQRDITLQMVAYLLVINNNSIQREHVAQTLLSGLLDYISMNGQHWGLATAYPTTGIESADVHGLTKKFEPHVKDWRLGTAVLARAADLYGSTNPISNLALWAITWEQMLRVGIDEFDSGGLQVLHSLQSRVKGEAAHTALTTVAAGLRFTDIDTDKGQIAGTLAINKAEDETHLTHYNLYWGSAPGEKLQGQAAIATLAKTGADITHTFAADTAIPTGAKYLLVYTQNNSIEEKAGVSLPINDVVPGLAAGITFTDLDTDNNQISGTLTINKAVDETHITRYNLYWGSDSTTKLSGQTIIASIAKIGADVTHTFAADTVIPTGATHLLVTTENSGKEDVVGINFDIQSL
ncbi:hypothetical protein AB835_03815 [Candidatus Endobugula sertula]|uniref:Uncharacterized protein n=1 Tax=Candidatus Endobugula sertula TaxID=62101 RepID=A0A1D2QS75_9GAMM|nr:hypothetical protein AB835_03815 [Candidatus Endobugula sertula]